MVAVYHVFLYHDGRHPVAPQRAALALVTHAALSVGVLTSLQSTPW